MDGKTTAVIVLVAIGCIAIAGIAIYVTNNMFNRVDSIPQTYLLLDKKTETQTGFWGSAVHYYFLVTVYPGTPESKWVEVNQETYNQYEIGATVTV